MLLIWILHITKVFLTLFFNQTKSEMLSALKMINYIVMHPL